MSSGRPCSPNILTTWWLRIVPDGPVHVLDRQFHPHRFAALQRRFGQLQQQAAIQGQIQAVVLGGHAPDLDLIDAA